LRIRQHVIDAAVAHARAEAPNECCGLLVGRAGTVDECVRTRNLKQGPTTYLIDPADHFETIRRARREGRAILGAYHSHPRSAAVPSATDVAEAHFPDLVYVIVSLAEPATPEVRGYAIAAGNFVGVPLVSVP
jgi:proteasome lid subunit RPN8/RPN11